MIKSISLQNFKCWEHIDDLQFAQLTGFFGTNSSGKTSLLEFLLLLKQTVQSADRKQVLNFGSERDYVELGSYDDMVFNHEYDRSFSFQIELQNDSKFEIKDTTSKANVILTSNEITFSCKISRAKAKRLYVNELSYNVENLRFTDSAIQKLA